MKRILAALVVVVASLGCSRGAPKYPPGHKVGISGLVGPIDIPFGVPPYPQPGITRVAADNNGNLIQSIGGGLYGPIVGGGADGGAGFSSDETIQLPNDAGVPVTALNLKTTLTNSTPGSEASSFTATMLNGGSPFAIPLDQANLSGKAAVTTSGSTPSVVMPATTDLLMITVGNDVTSLTVTGLNDSQDICYGIESQEFVNGHAQVFIKPNGHTGDAPIAGWFATLPGTPPATTTIAGFMFMDSDTSGNVGAAWAQICSAPGVARSYKVLFGTAMASGSFVEEYIGVTTTYTATMTSMVFAGAFKAGTVITLRRLRPTRN